MRKSNPNVPLHIAIIMDGNGRWARKRNLPRMMGHREGVKRVKEIVENVGALGIKYLTLYTFSTENWKRSLDEVNFLMKLFIKTAKEQLNDFTANNVKVRIMGEQQKLHKEVLDVIRWIEEKTENNTGLNLILAVNYGGREEIVQGVIKIIKRIKNNELELKDINSEIFSQYLYIKDIPDPDLNIRTSGEIRISNFLLWQIAYSEFYFTDVLWPDFDKGELLKALSVYNSRDRKFGNV